MSWLASLLAAIMLFFSSLTGGHVAPPAALATTTPAIPANAALVKSGDDYDLYLIADDAAGSGQYMAVDTESGAQTLLGQPFSASSTDLSGFYAQSVSQLADEKGKYLAFDTGTSVERSYAVYALPGGGEVARFCAQHAPLFWDDAIVYLACDRSGLNTAFEGGAPDIAATNLLTQATTTLVASHRPDDSRLFYEFVKLSGDTLTYDATPLELDTRGFWDFATPTPAEKTIDLSAVAW